MVCEGLNSIDCAFLLTSQQDIKFAFLIFYYIIFIFVWYYFTKDRIDKLKLQYLVWPIMTAKWSGFIYFIFSPIHILLIQSDLNYDIILGWYALFYFPTIIVISMMPFLAIFDKIFQYMGYKDTFEFVKKYRERLI